MKMKESQRTRAIVITGLMAAIAVVLGWTHWGFIPWFGGAALTIMHVPAIIAAIIVGPLSGAVVGLVFGLFSMLQAALAPTGPADVWFTNPLLSVFPRLFIGPAAWLIYQAFKRRQVAAIGISRCSWKPCEYRAGSRNDRFSWIFTMGCFGGHCHCKWNT